MPQSHKPVKNPKLASLNKNAHANISLQIIAFGLVIVAIVCVLACVLYCKDAKFAEKVYEITETAPVKVLTSHQNAHSGAYSIVISNVSESDKHDPAFTIADSDTILSLTIAITNTSDVAQDLYPASQFYIRSNDGMAYQMHPTVFLTKPLQAGPVKPGESALGEISFAIPKSLSQPLLYIDLGWNNYVPVVYDVLN